MIGYKAFKVRNRRLYTDHCSEIGYEFKLDEDNILYNTNIDPEYCERGFVFWKELKDVFKYHPLDDHYNGYNVYYKVESGDNVKTVPDNNCYHTISVTDRLKILKEVYYDDLLDFEGDKYLSDFNNILKPKPDNYEFIVKKDPFFL